MIVEDLGHHKVVDYDGDNHGVILVDAIDTLKVFILESDRRGVAWWWCINIVDVDVLDGVEVALMGLAGLFFVGESVHNGVDHPSYLLGRFLFLDSTNCIDEFPLYWCSFWQMICSSISVNQRVSTSDLCPRIFVVSFFINFTMSKYASKDYSPIKKLLTVKRLLDTIWFKGLGGKSFFAAFQDLNQINRLLNSWFSWRRLELFNHYK